MEYDCMAFCTEHTRQKGKHFKTKAGEFIIKQCNTTRNNCTNPIHLKGCTSTSWIEQAVWWQNKLDKKEFIGQVSIVQRHDLTSLQPDLQHNREGARQGWNYCQSHHVSTAIWYSLIWCMECYMHVHSESDGIAILLNNLSPPIHQIMCPMSCWGPTQSAFSLDSTPTRTLRVLPQ